MRKRSWVGSQPINIGVQSTDYGKRHLMCFHLNRFLYFIFFRQNLTSKLYQRISFIQWRYRDNSNLNSFTHYFQFHYSTLPVCKKILCLIKIFKIDFYPDLYVISYQKIYQESGFWKNSHTHLCVWLYGEYLELFISKTVKDKNNKFYTEYQTSVYT